MNNEIKEILDRLERIDHKEYSCGFEFADSGSFDEDCRCFEERKKMANYITNLQQENKQLKDNWNKLKEYIEKDYGFYDKLIAPEYGCAMGALRRIKDKMQELEQGSDSNE